MSPEAALLADALLADADADADADELLADAELAALDEPPEEQPTRASAATMTAMAAKTMYFLAFMCFLSLMVYSFPCAFRARDTITQFVGECTCGTGGWALIPFLKQGAGASLPQTEDVSLVNGERPNS